MLRKILLGTTVLGLAIVSSSAVQAQRYSNVGTTATMPNAHFDRNVQANIDTSGRSSAGPGSR